MIYIAGPIGNGHTAKPRTMYQNVKRAEIIYMLLVEKGYAPILPHFSYYTWLYWERDIHWETWVKMDEEYVKQCTYFFYMKPEDYGPSKGASHEFSLARKLGKTIFTSIPEVPNIGQINPKVH